MYIRPNIQIKMYVCKSHCMYVCFKFTRIKTSLLIKYIFLKGVSIDFSEKSQIVFFFNEFFWFLTLKSRKK